MKIHRVRKGESIYDIAGEYGVSPIKLAENNGISDVRRLLSGEELLIIVPTRSVNARRGDTLGDICRRFSVRECDILAMNPELMGRGVLYDGQVLGVKHETPIYGLGIGNGYFYRGCPTELLVRAMPYLGYVTVAAAVLRGGKISFLFDDKGIPEFARAGGKLPYFRVYIEDVSGISEWREFIRGAAIYATARNYAGITLGGIGKIGKDVRCEWVLEAKKLLLECDLSLFCEADLATDDGYGDYADGCILTYDKTDLEPIPPFDDAEGKLMEKYAEVHECMRTFIDLSPFAYTSGKYVTKKEARDALCRGGGVIQDVAGGDVLLGSLGRGKRERIFLWESMENTRKKLEAISSYCYFGVSFDIARIPIYDLLMFRSMFSSGIGVAL